MVHFRSQNSRCRKFSHPNKLFGDIIFVFRINWYSLVGLKLNIQKTKIMASSSITSWEIDGETVETVSELFFWAPKSLHMVTAAMKTVSDFIFLGSKVTADGDCSHEIKRHLLLGRKVMTNLDSMLKCRDITLPTKVHLVKAMVFQWSCMDVRVEL